MSHATEEEREEEEEEEEDLPVIAPPGRRDTFDLSKAQRRGRAGLRDDPTSLVVRKTSQSAEKEEEEDPPVTGPRGRGNTFTLFKAKRQGLTRRDLAFELSKKRGLTTRRDDPASRAVQEMSQPAKKEEEKEDAPMTAPPDGRDTLELSKAQQSGRARRRDDLAVVIHDSPPQDAGQDYLTPKEGGTVINVEAIVSEVGGSLRQDEEAAEVSPVGSRPEEVAAEEADLVPVLGLTSEAVTERMRALFPDHLASAYQYPLVSVRAFAAMAFAFRDPADLAPLPPSPRARADAEVVSLRTKEEREPVFLNRRVCFSGFDCSSTVTALGDVVGQGGGDLRLSVTALEAVLRRAAELPHAGHRLDVAGKALARLACSSDARDACAQTMVERFFPAARFGTVFRHYADEFADVRRHAMTDRSRPPGANRHIGVRYRLDDFVCRSVRYHLRELLNTLPEEAVEFNVDDCLERWGRAVDDRSISSALTFALERIHELAARRPEFFGEDDGDNGEADEPDFFPDEAAREHFRGLDQAKYESLAADIAAARDFLCGVRACRFILDLLRCPAVAAHVVSFGGWDTVEAFARTYEDLRLHEGSENGHLARLRDVRELLKTLEDVDARCAPIVEACEASLKLLRRQCNIKPQNPWVRMLRRNVDGTSEDTFPVIVAL